MTKNLRKLLLGRSQSIFNSAFQLMNEEQEGVRFLILNFNLLGLKCPEGGVSILISFAEFYAELNGIIHMSIIE